MPRVSGWPLIRLLVGGEAIDREQRQAQIAQSFQQAIQRRLVGNRPGQERVAVVFKGDDQAVKSVAPTGIQMAFDPELINRFALRA